PAAAPPCTPAAVGPRPASPGGRTPGGAGPRLPSPSPEIPLQNRSAVANHWSANQPDGRPYGTPVATANRSEQLPLALRLLMFVQGAGATLAGAPWGLLPPRGQWALFAVLALLGLAAGALKVELCARWGRITMAYAVTCFTLLAAGPGAALTVNALAALGGLY